MDENSYLNFFGGVPLGRFSWLRESTAFLNAAASAPSAKWILFRNGEPLVTKSDAGLRSLAYLSTVQVKPLTGEATFFGQGETHEKPLLLSEPLPKILEGARLRGPTVVVLGVKEKEGSKALPTTEFKTALDIPGDPYLALDVSRSPEVDVHSLLDATSTEFCEPRTATATFDSFDAPIFSIGRSMIDWNARHRFCPGCGSPVYSLWGGWKLSCSSLLPWVNSEGKDPCISAKGLHNFNHPRTDPVVITVILDERDDRILLGRNKRFPPGFYSALAGFMEPSESFEDAVKREPWPYPANLMIGFYAWANPDQTIRTDLDTELEDAKWFTREEVLAVLSHPQGSSLSSRELKNLDIEHRTADAIEDRASGKPPAFRVPSASSAIAGALISEWAYEKVQGLKAPFVRSDGPQGTMIKGKI